jgi:hypothetical protein
MNQGRAGRRPLMNQRSAQYQQKTDRQLPVIRLAPRAAAWPKRADTYVTAGPRLRASS